MLRIDADIICYTCGFVMEQVPKLYRVDTHEEIAPLFVVTTLIDNLFLAYNETRYKMYLSSKDDSNFRIKLAKTREYKGNRKDKRKPIWINEVREYLLRKYSPTVVHGMEADDAICIDHYSDWKQGNHSIAISEDKDIKQIPGLHGDFKGNITEVKDEMGELWLIEKKYNNSAKYILKGTGLKFLYSQIITGDPADDYPGMKGVGPKAAFNALNLCKTEKELYNKTLELFKGDTTLMDEQAGLAYMLREPDDSWLKRKKKLLIK